MNRLSPFSTIANSLMIVAIATMIVGCGDADADATSQADNDSPSVMEAPAELQNAPMTAAELRKALKANEKAKFRKVGGEIVEAHLLDSGVTDITPLKGLPLRMLDLGRCDVSDISVIEGMPLTQLILEDTKVTDLSPIEGMQLEILWLQNTPVNDISPAAGMPLKQLNLLGTKVTDISVTRDMPLDILWMAMTPLKDLSGFENSNLESLDIRGTQVTDLSPIVGMKRLQRLNIVDCNIKDISPLGKMTLQRLLLTPSNVEKGFDELRKSPVRQIGVDGINVESALAASEFWKAYDEGAFNPQKSETDPAEPNNEIKETGESNEEPEAGVTDVSEKNAADSEQPSGSKDDAENGDEETRDK